MARPPGHAPHKPQSPDENFRPHATSIEWQYYTAYCRLGSHDAVAEALGKSRRAIGAALERMVRRAAAQGYEAALDLLRDAPNAPTLKGIRAAIPDESWADDAFEPVAAMLRKRQMTLAETAQLAGGTKGQALDWIEAQQAAGLNIHLFGDRYSIEREAAPAFIASGGELPEYASRPDNTFLFGVTSDNHLGSRYERLDVLNALYDRFAQEKVDRVFNAGNWIDGEARFNRTDLHVHGADAQLRYLAEKYPRRDGLITYAVTGDDHEGWIAQREGVNIGRMAQNAMRDAGRADWVDCGYMEAHFKLVNANTGKSSILALVHPGGGTAYALSYSVQKTIESLDGGEKPAVALYGHYHKLWAGNIRNVWCLITGCTKDQDPFMRKKKIEAHVGGALVRLEQDPESGAIIGFTPTMMRWFNRGFYANRWSHNGPVTLPERSIGGR